MTPETIKTLWASGFVNRWHSNPDPRLRCSNDTTAAHSQRVAILVDLLYDEMDPHWQTTTAYTAVRAAILHDAPECATGDSPYTAKRDLRLRQVLGIMEAEWLAEQSVGITLSPIVEICDQIDAIMFCRHVAPDLLERGDWREHREWVLSFASQLGLREIVEELISG